MKWLWLIWALVGLGLEVVSILTISSGDTLTEVILLSFPAWVVWLGLGWLTIHFGRRLLKR